MPVAPVDANGTVLYYEDSGPLEGNYTTLVIVHGTAFHGAFFRRMIPYAAPNNLRLVLLNRRDYPGSTPLTDTELSALKSICDPTSPTYDASKSLEAQSNFLKARGFEVAEFMAWFAKTENVPKVVNNEDGGKESGMVLVAWSSANGTALGLFAHLKELRREVREYLEPYMRTYLYYDGPRWVIGFPHDDRFDRPLVDPNLTQDERLEQFKVWIGSYYSHNPVAFATHDLSLLSGTPMTNPPPEKIATLERLSPQEIESVRSRYAQFHSEAVVRIFGDEVYGAHFREGMFGRGEGIIRFTEKKEKSAAEEDEKSVVWPNVGIRVLQCQDSLWEIVSAIWVIEELYNEPENVRKREKGEAGRKIEFTLMEGANHCLRLEVDRKTNFDFFVHGSVALIYRHTGTSQKGSRSCSLRWSDESIWGLQDLTRNIEVKCLYKRPRPCIAHALRIYFQQQAFTAERFGFPS